MLWLCASSAELVTSLERCNQGAPRQSSPPFLQSSRAPSPFLWRRRDCKRSPTIRQSGSGCVGSAACPPRGRPGARGVAPPKKVPPTVRAPSLRQSSQLVYLGSPELYREDRGGTVLHRQGNQSFDVHVLGYVRCNTGGRSLLCIVLMKAVRDLGRWDDRDKNNVGVVRAAGVL